MLHNYYTVCVRIATFRVNSHVFKNYYASAQYFLEIDF